MINRAKGIGLLTLVIGLMVGSYYMGAKTVQSKTESTEEDKVRTDVVTEVREVVRKDGSKETVTKITDKTKSDSKSKSTVTVAAKNYMLIVNQVSAIRTRDRDAESAYEIMIYRRFYSSIYLGLGFDTKQRYKLGVGLEF